MTFIVDNIFDNGLAYLVTNGETINITNAEATTYTEADSTFKLGTKTSAVFNAISNGAVDGRRVVTDAITDGSVSVTDTATHWAAVKDSATSELLATNSLSSSQAVTNGNTFTLDAISITIRDAA